MGWAVLGLAIADREPGGASAWGFVVTAGSAGFVAALLAFGIRPEHPLRATQLALLLAPLGGGRLGVGARVG